MTGFSRSTTTTIGRPRAPQGAPGLLWISEYLLQTVSHWDRAEQGHCWSGPPQAESHDVGRNVVLLALFSLFLTESLLGRGHTLLPQKWQEKP